ncbi:MAG TPA: DUF1552 domain-containing protein [Bryobacteraceae bacterium]|jgi:hypothetical protein|nr:DUF1552 domain-containing protein [Bryobacteraceae bacterium]
MFLKKSSLDRRTFLRGVGATLALPLLDAMTPAFASSGNAIPRLGFIYIPNGVNLAEWTPKETAPGFAFSSTLSSLEPFRDRVTVLSGLAHHAADRLNDGAGDHSRAAGAFLSGCHAKRTEGADLYLGITADQIAAKALGKDNLLPSLELKLDDSDIAPLCDEGYTCAYMNTFSWSSPTTPLPMENNPRLVFQRLFGEGQTAKERVIQTREDRSILDAVTGSMKRLQSTLGADDRRKMDQYFDAIREVELRLQRIEAKNADASVVARGGSRPLGVPDKFEDHINLMFDLQVLAFQADITRVTTLMIGREEGGRSYPQIGVPDGHHSISHHDNNPEKLAKLAKIDAYHVQQLAIFLGKLRNTPDGGSNLLDNSMILYGGGISNGNMHNHERLPVVVAGGGTGQLKGGRHLEYKQDMPMSNVLRSVLDKAGVHTDTLGDATGLLAEL